MLLLQPAFLKKQNDQEQFPIGNFPLMQRTSAEEYSGGEVTKRAESENEAKVQTTKYVHPFTQKKNTPASPSSSWPAVT